MGAIRSAKERRLLAKAKDIRLLGRFSPIALKAIKRD